LEHRRTDFAGVGAVVAASRMRHLSVVENSLRRAYTTTWAFAADNAGEGADQLIFSLAPQATDEASGSEERLTACKAALG